MRCEKKSGATEMSGTSYRKILAILLLAASLLVFTGSATAQQGLECQLVQGSVPSGYTQVLGMSAETSAHAELPGQNNYKYKVVCQDTTGSSSIGTSSSGTRFLFLNSETDAHAEITSYSSYDFTTHLSSSEGSIRCNYPSDGSSSSGSTCLFKTAQRTNSHVSSCSASSPQNAVSCSLRGVSQSLQSNFTQGPCPEGYTSVLKAFDSTNAHAELPNMTNYDYNVCVGTSGDIQIGTDPSGEQLAFLKQTSNSHVELPSYSPYNFSAYISSPDKKIDVLYQDGRCPVEYTCMLTVSGDTDAHVAGCPADTDNAYSTQVCARFLDAQPPEINCDGCIDPTVAETGQTISITPEVTDTGSGVGSVDVCLDESCSEVICGSANCTYSSDTVENRDVYVRALDNTGNSVTERIGGFLIGKPVGATCTEDQECVTGSCEEGECTPEQIPPSVSFTSGGGEMDAVQLGVLERRDINISISNLLPVRDEITIRFSGRAVNGLISGEVDVDNGISCNEDHSACNVSVGGESERKVGLTIAGVSVGSGALVVKAVSQSTQLEAKDRIDVNTRPRTEEGPVSAPGMTLPYFALLILVATGYIYLNLLDN
ncbi:MAG: hypothetical protein SVV03_03835 [Candidatus Nanohaloarchaea archaeon]|nr:hypothetical protein [Candidatus Nanohaloarchaea archaeon]